MNTETFVARISLAAQLRHARKRLIRSSKIAGYADVRDYYLGYIDALRFAARLLHKSKASVLALFLLAGLAAGCGHRVHVYQSPAGSTLIWTDLSAEQLGLGDICPEATP